MTVKAKTAFASAKSLALSNGNHHTDSYHLAHALLNRQGGVLYMAISNSHFGGGVGKLVQSVKRILLEEMKKSCTTDFTQYTDSLKKVISEARVRMVLSKSAFLDVDHLLHGLLLDSSIRRVLNDAGV